MYSERLKLTNITKDESILDLEYTINDYHLYQSIQLASFHEFLRDNAVNLVNFILKISLLL